MSLPLKVLYYDVIPVVQYRTVSLLFIIISIYTYHISFDDKCDSDNLHEECA